MNVHFVPRICKKNNTGCLRVIFLFFVAQSDTFVKIRIGQSEGLEKDSFLYYPPI